MLKEREIGLRSREGQNIQLSDRETRDAEMKKQVPKIASFSSQTLSVNSALLTQFHLERYKRTTAEENGERCEEVRDFSRHITYLLK